MSSYIHKNVCYKIRAHFLFQGQFIFLIGYLLQLLVFGCDAPRRFTQFAVLNTFSFLLLFMNFYRNTYTKSTPKDRSATTDMITTDGLVQKVHAE